jgi:hypothetical protein
MTAPDQGPDRGELLARVLTGELSPDAPEVRRAMAADPSVAGELRELARLADELAEADAMTSPPATGSDAEPWPGADDMVRRQVRSSLPRPDTAGTRSEPRAEERSRRRLPTWRLVLAAALIVVVVGWRAFGGSDLPTAPPDVRLGRQLWPRGDVTRDQLLREGFHWEDPEHPTTIGRFQVVVRNPNGDDVLKSLSLGTTERWLPTREQVDSLPTVITWTVTLQVGGESQPPWTATATLR